jgi:hypothetical protein
MISIISSSNNTLLFFYRPTFKMTSIKVYFFPERRLRAPFTKSCNEMRPPYWLLYFRCRILKTRTSHSFSFPQHYHCFVRFEFTVKVVFLTIQGVMEVHVETLITSTTRSKLPELIYNFSTSMNYFYNFLTPYLTPRTLKSLSILF